MISLFWVPSWRCNNYGRQGEPSESCPYCWFGFNYKTNRLTFNGRDAAGGEQADAARIIDGVRRNRVAIGGRVAIAGGGEPLMYPRLALVVGTLVVEGFRWAITSNCLLTDPLRSLIANCGGSLRSCVSWTVSIHAYQADRWERLAENVRTIRAAGVEHLSATIVVARSTLPILANMVRAAGSLPFDRVQYHVDEKDEDPAGLIDASREFLPAGAAFYMVGYSPAGGIFCGVNRTMIVVAPNGVAFQCLRKAIDGIDPIGYLDETDLIDLSPAGEWCALKCPFGCDHAKHLIPTPPAPVVL